MNQKDSQTLIFGCNALGREVAEALISNGVDVQLVDADAEAVEQLQQLGLPARREDALDDRVLRELGLGRRVRQIFCFFQDDADNVFLVLSARDLAAEGRLQIIAVADSLGGVDKLKAAGADKVIDPYETTAHKIHSQITRPLLAELSDALLFSHDDFSVTEVVLTEPSRFIGRQLSDVVHAVEDDVIILGMTDYEMDQTFHFRGKYRDHHLDAGDVLVVIGPHDAVRGFRRWVNQGGGGA